MTNKGAYHGNPELKAKLIEQLKWHMEQDAIYQGTYGQRFTLVDGGPVKWRGCAIACSARSLDRAEGKLDEERGQYHSHMELTERLNIPPDLLHEEDEIFEALSEDMARDWPLRFAEAIEPGADLEEAYGDYAEKTDFTDGPVHVWADNLIATLKACKPCQS